MFYVSAIASLCKLQPPYILVGWRLHNDAAADMSKAHLFQKRLATSSKDQAINSLGCHTIM
jgi:hypothetical protein